MSTKTLRKRIALVAVSALGAGLLSVVAVPSANAAVPTTGLSFVAYKASTTGAAIPAAGDQDTQASVGFVARTSATGTDVANKGFTLGSSGALTATVLPGAKLAFAASTSTTSGDSLGIVASGGTLSAFTCENAGTASMNGSATTAACVQASTTMSTGVGVLNVSAAAGATATLSFYKGTAIAGTTTATSGTLIGTWTFIVVPASTSGTYNAANSSISFNLQLLRVEHLAQPRHLIALHVSQMVALALSMYLQKMLTLEQLQVH